MQVSEGSVNNNTASIKNLKGFDGNCPPDPKLIDSCVHCGFCLSTCPSYRVLGKEMDSPRGRIYLMDAINEGEIALNTATVEHFDSCLGCLACVSTCPSGVQYDKLISATRHQVERNYNRSLPDKLVRQLIFSLFPNPDLLRILLFPLLVYQKLGISKVLQATGLIKAISPRLAAMESILPEITLKSFQDNLPDIIPAKGEKRYRVGVILGCVQNLLNTGADLIASPNPGCSLQISKYLQGKTISVMHPMELLDYAIRGDKLDI
ncbi:4Fe-4S dicluster domain-containing protein [Anabaena sp. AL93]|uniref:4Fe-4S dicluster domain-containing protein n=1 Tax=Anabaena sp. AL93 TaxID=1678133 RepID=UPI00080200B1|nr:4Fe-4S dicluster domain-containing protein [Anabaena sp. AL93]OBQ17063.1 MAG: hypothetical protein AN486_16435 [Anabaena sp. AL93]